jgi:flagellar hook-length control protein FliK
MIAERSEAKRLIEQNISELKHGLAQHNLSMDKIDVFIGDRGAQFQNHQNKPDFQQAREFAQQFQNGHAQYRQKDSDEQDGGRARIAKPQPEKFRSMLPARRLDQGRLNVVA